ncbi:MAG: hypothetical protein GEV10_18070 [Streptosporangiales bacterium]|nr:hypothetical protein [Streptosporangiales bacterium]
MFLDNLLLWVHIAAAIFCLGPVTLATSFTPRYVRNGDASVVRFLLLTTRIFGLLTLLVFLTGLALGRDELGRPWLTVAMTLFIVAFALLFAIVQRDQAAALKVLTPEPEEPAPPAADDAEAATDTERAPAATSSTSTKESASARGASVQTGRIAAFSGVIALLWLVILVFMVWQPGG